MASGSFSTQHCRQPNLGVLERKPLPPFSFIFLCTESKPESGSAAAFLFLLLVSKELLTVFRKEKIVGSRELSTVQFSVVSGESMCFTFYVFIVIMSVHDGKDMCAMGPR